MATAGLIGWVIFTSLAIVLSFCSFENDSTFAIICAVVGAGYGIMLHLAAIVAELKKFKK